MAASLVLTVIFVIAGAAGWALMSLVAGHTGFELLLDAFRLRLPLAVAHLAARLLDAGARDVDGGAVPDDSRGRPLVARPRAAAGVEIAFGTSDGALGIVLVSIFTLSCGVSAAAERTHRSPA